MTALHAILGIVVGVTTLMAFLHARAGIRAGRAYEQGLYLGATAVVDLQVVVGAIIWADGRLWESDGLAFWGHPLSAFLALLVVHAGVIRAGRERWAAEAYRITSRTMMLTIVLLGVSWWTGRFL